MATNGFVDAQYIPVTGGRPAREETQGIDSAERSPFGVEIVTHSHGK